MRACAWSGAQLRRSAVDARLCAVAPGGACWSELAPLVDETALRRLKQQLDPTGVLAPHTDRLELPGGAELTVRATSALGGAGLWSPRLAPQRAIEVNEYVRVSGPADEASLDIALGILEAPLERLQRCLTPPLAPRKCVHSPCRRASPPALLRWMPLAIILSRR